MSCRSGNGMRISRRRATPGAPLVSDIVALYLPAFC
jgi:hypothetical protein